MNYELNKKFVKIEINPNNFYYLRLDKIVAIQIINRNFVVTTDIRLSDNRVYTVTIDQHSPQAQALMAYFDKLVVFPELSPPITE
jgi:hypothetical protein